jgi:hypothetical protein
MEAATASPIAKVVRKREPVPSRKVEITFTTVGDGSLHATKVDSIIRIFRSAMLRRAETHNGNEDQSRI